VAAGAASPARQKGLGSRQQGAPDTPPDQQSAGGSGWLRQGPPGQAL